MENCNFFFLPFFLFLFLTFPTPPSFRFSPSSQLLLQHEVIQSTFLLYHIVILFSSFSFNFHFHFHFPNPLFRWLISFYFFFRRKMDPETLVQQIAQDQQDIIDFGVKNAELEIPLNWVELCRHFMRVWPPWRQDWPTWPVTLFSFPHMHVYRITLYIHSQMEPSSFTSLTAPTPAPTDLHRLSWGSWISELVITLLLVLFAIINSHPRRGLGESDLNETALMKRALGLLSLWGPGAFRHRDSWTSFPGQGNPGRPLLLQPNCTVDEEEWCDEACWPSAHLEEIQAGGNEWRGVFLPVLHLHVHSAPPFPPSMLTLIIPRRKGLCRTRLWCLREPRPFSSSWFTTRPRHHLIVLTTRRRLHRHHHNLQVRSRWCWSVRCWSHFLFD